MRLGVNYTPSAGWFHSWLDLDPAAVRRDLEDIASLGVDHVRLFPLWELVQPNRGLIRPAALEDIGTVIGIAAELGLDVNVDALQGHLSSFDFLPAWLSSWHRRNMFTDPEAIEAECRYLRALGELLAGRPNVIGLTLGNELNQFAGPAHPEPHRVDQAQADAWLATLIEAARGAQSGLVTHAMYDAAWYDDAQPFTPAHAAEHGDATVVHSWVFNGAAQRYGALGAGSLRHAEYLVQLAAAWHREPGRTVWLQELGAPSHVVRAPDIPAFVEGTVRHAAAVPGLWGITWWCSHDIPRELADFPAFEHELGLFDGEHRLKPAGRRFAELVAELRRTPPAPPARTGLLLEDSAPGYRARCAPGGSFFEAWLRIARVEGRGPQVVLASRAAERGALTARGVDRLLAPDAIDAR